jgi:hypothetical protein
VGLFDRVTFHCQRCGVDGHISAALLSRSEVYLEGNCHACGQTSLKRLALAPVDRWLHDQADTPVARVH